MANNSYDKLTLVNQARIHAGLNVVTSLTDQDFLLYDLERVELLSVLHPPFSIKTLDLKSLKQADEGFYYLPGDFICALDPKFWERIGDKFRIRYNNRSRLKYVANVEAPFETGFASCLIYGLATRYAEREPINDRADFIQNLRALRQEKMMHYRRNFTYSEPLKVSRQYTANRYYGYGCSGW